MTRRKPKTNQKKKTTDPKVVFRRSKEWHTFREKKRKEQKTDPITGSQLTKTCNCHHLDLDPKHYTEIEKEENFICLNSTTHSVIHWFFGDGKTRKDWRKRIKKVVEILELMEELNEVHKR